MVVEPIESGRSVNTDDLAEESAADRRRTEDAITAFQAGQDPDRAFRILFERYYPAVRSFFAKRVSLPEDRLDLTQETFMRVYTGLKGFRRESQFGTWLFRVAQNTYLKHLRRRRPEDNAMPLPVDNDTETSAHLAAAFSTSETALDTAIDGERQRLLRSAIEDLPRQMRQSTELRIYQELSYREISVVMRLSVETVKVHLFQARKKLRQKIQDADDLIL